MVLKKILRMTDQLLENQKPEKEPKKKPQKTPPPIWVPITLVICAYIWGLLLQFKWEVERAIYMITHVPGVLFDAFGMFLMLVLGLIHLVISQFYKNKRNSYSRRYIIIYWSLAAFALRPRCPIVPARVERLSGANFRVTFYPPIEIPDSGDIAKDTESIMIKANGIIENWIRETPSQWLWLHRRWGK